jgi:hypothetical protein
MPRRSTGRRRRRPLEANHRSTRGVVMDPGGVGRSPVRPGRKLRSREHPSMKTVSCATSPQTWSDPVALDPYGLAIQVGPQRELRICDHGSPSAKSPFAPAKGRFRGSESRRSSATRRLGRSAFRLRNASGMTSRIELERAAERLESRSHAERGNEGFPGHDVFGLGIGKLFPARSLGTRRE